MKMPKDNKIAILIPCLNEELTIVKVVEDFKKVLSDATIYVFDNNSDDMTAQLAKQAGAKVYQVESRGKGNVINSMFRHIDADIYLMVDGDDTYYASDAHKLINPIIEDDADMVVGDRLSDNIYDQKDPRRFHSFGNRLVRWLINKQYQTHCNDVLSGYRAFNRFFVCNFPLLSEGFEIETEMTLHTLDKRFVYAEVPIKYKNRPLGSESKLNTFSDGFRIIKTISLLFKNYKPFSFFFSLALLLALSGFVVGFFPIWEYIQHNYVYKVPLAFLAASLEILAMLLFCCGLILDTAVRQHREMIELRILDYLKNTNKGER